MFLANLNGEREHVLILLLGILHAVMFALMFAVLLHLAEETVMQDSGLGLSYLLALPNVSIHVRLWVTDHD